MSPRVMDDLNFAMITGTTGICMKIARGRSFHAIPSLRSLSLADFFPLLVSLLFSVFPLFLGSLVLAAYELIPLSFCRLSAS